VVLHQRIGDFPQYSLGVCRAQARVRLLSGAGIEDSLRELYFIFQF
jgi:hypothetical protein